MIRSFWVENYLSIRKRQELDFIAKSPDSELVATMPDGEHIYKLGILYGPNASGKSNMLKALATAFHMLVDPKTDAGGGLGRSKPFLLTVNDPTRMFISFYADMVRYDYEVAFDAKRILNETLYYYPNGSKSLFYERNHTNDDVQDNIKFGISLHLSKKTQNSIRENTLRNHSVLAVCKKNSFTEDFAPFVKLHGWIMAHYHEVDGDNMQGPVQTLQSVVGNERKRAFFNKMLQKADLNITDFEISMVDDLTRKTAIPTALFTNTAGDKVFSAPLDLQSQGTIQYLGILNQLYDLITGNHIYYLDELGAALHYDLLLYYLNVFIYNSECSQLIITSQETALLAEDMLNLNRGAVWFVEKNHETASSEYTRGDDFGLHKNLSFYHSYKIGRLGAKPDLGSFFIDINK